MELDPNAKLLLHYDQRVAIFSGKFHIPTTFSSVIFQPRTLIFSLKEAKYFKGTTISVSFLVCGDDILIIWRCVFMYLISYFTGKFYFKNQEKHNRKVLKSKLSFKKIAIFTGEYLQNNK